MNPEQTCDVIVAGATLGGCLAAAAAARRGARVVLVEASPFLGTDLTAVLRLWIAGTPDPDPVFQRLRELLLPSAEAVEVDLDRRDLPPGWPVEARLFRGGVRKRPFDELDGAGGGDAADGHPGGGPRRGGLGHRAPGCRQTGPGPPACPGGTGSPPVRKRDRTVSAGQLHGRSAVAGSAPSGAWLKPRDQPPPGAPGARSWR